MKKILIVEDVDLNVDLLLQLLEDEYELVVATDGAAGVSRAIEERPDLILMDMSLPVMDGYAATQAIRSNPALNGVIIIGLSAHAMSGDKQKALDAGCDDYVSKPIEIETLMRKMNEFLSL